MSWPHTFAALSGDVPASYLDDNFNAAVQLSAPANTMLGNNTGSAANQANLTPPQIYALLKGSFPWEVAGFVGGVPGNSWQVLRYQPSTPVIIVQSACTSTASVAATGSTTFTLADNGTGIGTVVFSASGAVGAVTITGSPYTLAAGHVLTLTAPGTADATLANINFTFGGTRG